MNKIKNLMSVTGWTKEDWEEAINEGLFGLGMGGIVLILMIAKLMGIDAI